eukprot:11411148-Alexandrium_andersonii.AAC.1
MTAHEACRTPIRCFDQTLRTDAATLGHASINPCTHTHAHQHQHQPAATPAPARTPTPHSSPCQALNKPGGKLGQVWASLGKPVRGLHDALNGPSQALGGSLKQA